MAEIIAGTYEIQGFVGEGGGGSVYLARHLRLDKKVVLKADKRRLSTKPELLRREVDVLKNLTHTNIPKVFDFFVENDTVYTVMDFIEGDSLDKPLKKGERFSQPQVIKWAKQLLCALSYLHSETHGDPPRGYVHSDIKPANLMLTPYGDICLIDFNIALALGEENVIGCSAGYASPEHYGLDYSSGFTQTNTAHTGRTELTGSEKTELADSARSTTGSKRVVIPDVRSDIFSTGATLYHLLSGKRPAKDAMSVAPLDEKEFSAPLVRIITRAMNPNPDLRYQTADEMLYDLEHLHENDPRVKRAKRGFAIAEAAMCVLLSAGVFCAFVGLKRQQVAESRMKLVEYSANAMAAGDRELALEYAKQAAPAQTGLLSPEITASAQLALTEALGVYDLSDGYAVHKAIELASAPLCMAISPEGGYCACIVSGRLAVIDTMSGEVLCELSADTSALSEVEFVCETMLLFAADGGLCCYDIQSKSELWRGEPATAISVSADGTTAAAVYKDNGSATIYSVSDGSVIAAADFSGKTMSTAFNDIFANPRDSIFELNSDGKKLAVSFSDGSLDVFNVDNTDIVCEIITPNAEFTHYEGGFNGYFLAFSATGENGSAFAVVDCSTNTQTGGFQSDGYFGCKADESGIYLQQGELVVALDPVTGAQTPLVAAAEEIRGFAVGSYGTLAATEGGFGFYDRVGALMSEYESEFTADFLLVSDKAAVIGFSDSPVVRIMKRNDSVDSEIFCYDPSVLHSEARLSADRQTVMLFSYNEFSIYDIGGELVTTVEIPDAEQVYDQQFRRDGDSSYLEVIYYSGAVKKYSAADGAIIGEEQSEKPDDTLAEEFTTSTLRFESPLHGAPKAYDIKSGELVAELTPDAYLTYITEVGDNIIAQYITADGYYYGVLMNKECEELAVMPYLCDITQDSIIFDYPTGSLRETRLYTLNELLSAAR